MFFGSYEHALDDKNRLVIPSKMRNELSNKAYILKGFDGALTIYKEEQFEKVVSELENIPFSKKDARAYARIQLASVCELEIDKAGRVQIPTQLKMKHNINKVVMIIGVGDHIEVWDKDAYLAYEKEMDEKFEGIAENLGDMNNE